MPIGQLKEQMPHWTQLVDSGTTHAKVNAWRRRFSRSKRWEDGFKRTSGRHEGWV